MDYEDRDVASAVSHALGYLINSSKKHKGHWDCPIMTDLLSCIKNQIWMPSNEPEGKLCSALEVETRQALADGAKKLIRRELTILPEKWDSLIEFYGKARDVISKQFSLFLLPVDKEAVSDMIDEMVDALDEMLDSDDVEDDGAQTFFGTMKRYLDSITDGTKTMLTKVISRIQG